MQYDVTVPAKTPDALAIYNTTIPNEPISRAHHTGVYRNLHVNLIKVIWAL